MASTEDIEAKLCAYIDGELDAAGRVEIEQHLAGNAQHRVLIGELTRQREMIRALPRERAPQDITESLNAHLERSVLLGDDASDDARIVRISHWPQIRAAAAILLLVFGLASVVYYVLPRPGADQSELATIRDVDGLDSTGLFPVPADVPGTGTVLTDHGEPDLFHRPPSPEETRTRIGLDGVIPSIRAAASDEISPRDAITGGASGGRSEPFAADAVVVEVIGPNPSAARQQVERFLVSNQIRFEKATMPQPLALEDSQMGLGSRLQNTQMRMKQDIAQSAAPAIQPLEKDIDTGSSASVAPAAPGSARTVDDDEKKRELAEQSAQPPPPTLSNNDADTSQRQYLECRMKRQDVDAMCSQISDRSAGQVAQVVQGSRLSSPNLSLQPSDPTNTGALNDRSLMRFDLYGPATRPDGTAGELFGGLVPATNPSEELVDVVIVVRSDASSSIESEPSTRPAEESREIESPATAPATAPSSPQD